MSDLAKVCSQSWPAYLVDCWGQVGLESTCFALWLQTRKLNNNKKNHFFFWFSSAPPLVSLWEPNSLWAQEKCGSMARNTASTGSQKDGQVCAWDWVRLTAVKMKSGGGTDFCIKSLTVLLVPHLVRRLWNKEESHLAPERQGCSKEFSLHVSVLWGRSANEWRRKGLIFWGLKMKYLQCNRERHI